MMTVEKTCSRCDLTKPVSAFGKDKSRSKDGLRYWCKDCMRERYESNKGARLEYHRQYRESNRDKVLEGKRRSYHANRDELRERSRQYRADNAAVLRERARRYRDGGRPADKPWPDRPIAYSTAHSRVKATYGAASNYSCSRCGEQAHAWSYDHSDPNPLWHKGVGLWADKPPIPYSSDPQRYDPMCRSCHVKRDRHGAA